MWGSSRSGVWYQDSRDAKDGAQVPARLRRRKRGGGEAGREREWGVVCADLTADTPEGPPRVAPLRPPLHSALVVKSTHETAVSAMKSLPSDFAKMITIIFRDLLLGSLILKKSNVKVGHRPEIILAHLV